MTRSVHAAARDPSVPTAVLLRVSTQTCCEAHRPCQRTCGQQTRHSGLNDEHGGLRFSICRVYLRRTFVGSKQGSLPPLPIIPSALLEKSPRETSEGLRREARTCLWICEVFDGNTLDLMTKRVERSVTSMQGQHQPGKPRPLAVNFLSAFCEPARGETLGTRRGTGYGPHLSRSLNAFKTFHGIRAFL